MPIKPGNRARYPKEWPTIRAAILKRAGNCCEQCGVPNYAKGYRDKGQFIDVHEPMAVVDGFKIIRIVLTIAHLDHIEEHCADDNLRALCQRCHLALDLQQHIENARRTRRARLAIADLFEFSA